ncbi:MAG TPA: hypothetical protein VFE33_28835, partial [Thermoanaerobaculia bacterium]|nr:hypothetical protein [Thermoanaerobaculia bacterium]
GMLPADLGKASARRLLRVYTANVEAVRRYTPEPYPGKVALVRAARRPEEDPTLGWGALAPGIEVTALDADHYGLLQEPVVGEVARVFRSRAGEP